MVNIKDIDTIHMQKSIRRRIPLFFKEGTFEIQVTWDNENDNEGEIVIRKT